MNGLLKAKIQMENNNINENTQINSAPKPENKQKQIILSVIIVLLFVGLAIFLGGNKPPLQKSNDNQATENQIRPVSVDEHIIGNPNAKIVIVEYSDTECPFCKRFHETMQSIVVAYNGDLAWVYRHYPIPQLHEKAFKEAEATECVWEQGGNDMFWKYTNELYNRTRSNDSFPVEGLFDLAKEMGADIGIFTKCLEDRKYENKIENDIMDGKKLGVKGTPTSAILINGEVVDIIEGSQDFEGLKERLDYLLK